jgi:hypothetical protein
MTQELTVNYDKNKSIKFFGTIDLNLDVMDLLGTAKLTAPNVKGITDVFVTGKEKVEVVGGSTKSGRLIYGRVALAKRVGDSFEIQMEDMGYKSKETYSGTYNNERLEDVVKKICKAFEFTAKFVQVPKNILDKQISSMASTETAVGNPTGTVPSAASAGTVTGLFKCSCGEKVDGKWYQTTILNYCPICGKSGTMVYHLCDKQPCVTQDCGSKEFKNIYPEGHFFCCQAKGGSDEDYCGVTGREHGPYKDIPGKQLTIISQSVVASGPAGTNGSTSNATTATASTPTVSTYEDAIFQICAENDLYCYKDQNQNLIFRYYSGTAKADVKLDMWAVQRSSFTFINGDKDDQATTVTVKYKNGTITKSFGGTGDTKIKTTESNVGSTATTNANGTSTNGTSSASSTGGPQVYDRPDLDKKGAEELAQKTINQTLREKNIKLGLTSLTSPDIYPGLWMEIATLNNPLVKATMYVCSINTKRTKDEDMHTSIVMKFAPPVPEYGQTAQSSTANLANIDAIGQRASQFLYASGCSDAACLESGGSGDCYAMSFWLSEKLNSIGVQNQILWCSGPHNHRTVQINQNGQWVDFDYKKYNIAKMFRVSQDRSGCRVYNGG